MTEIRFVTSLVDVSKIPQDFSSILILGRSNVGKSSFINALFKRKAIAKISNKPGKTSTINLYFCDFYYLLDTPGYGYAKRSQKQRKFFLNLIFQIINNVHQQKIKLVFLLIDFKIGPTTKDLFFYNKLIVNFKVVIIATKSDKVKANLKKERKELIREKFAKTQKIYFISNKKKSNLDLIAKEIYESTKL